MNDFDMMINEFMNEYGFMALYVKSTGEYDPSVGEIVGDDVEIPVRAIILDLTLRSNGLTNVPGTEIQAGDKMLYIQPPNRVDPGLPPLIVEPVKDRIKVGEVIYKVVTVKDTSISGDTPLFYELYIRR